MALAYLTINLDAFTGDDRPPISQYSITLDPGADHIDEDADVIHVRTIVVSLDQQGKAATANGVPCVDGKVPVVAGVMYAVLAPNVLRDGPHYIPALTAGQVVALSDYITPGAPLTPDQAAILTARIKALETTPPDHGALTGLGEDDHLIYLTTGRGDARYVQGSDSRLSDARTPTAHTHGIADLTATGTPSATTYLRGDGTWATPAGGGGSGPLTGTGSPEGVIAASVGTEYTDTSGTNGAWRWLKMSGSGNTGWNVTVGDTGWRSVTSANLVTGTLMFRRVGSDVSVGVGTAPWGIWSVASASIVTLGQLPLGFRLSTWTAYTRIMLDSSKTQVGNLQVATGDSNYIVARFSTPSTAGLVCNPLRFVTNDPWPTVLPGTPA